MRADLDVTVAATRLAEVDAVREQPLDPVRLPHDRRVAGGNVVLVEQSSDERVRLTSRGHIERLPDRPRVWRIGHKWTLDLPPTPARLRGDAVVAFGARVTR